MSAFERISVLDFYSQGICSNSDHVRQQTANSKQQTEKIDIQGFALFLYCSCIVCCTGQLAWEIFKRCRRPARHCSRPGRYRVGQRKLAKLCIASVKCLAWAVRPSVFLYCIYPPALEHGRLTDTYLGSRQSVPSTTPTTRRFPLLKCYQNPSSASPPPTFFLPLLCANAWRSYISAIYIRRAFSLPQFNKRQRVSLPLTTTTLPVEGSWHRRHLYPLSHE